jgi:hypothetical protein
VGTLSSVQKYKESLLSAKIDGIKSYPPLIILIFSFFLLLKNRMYYMICRGYVDNFSPFSLHVLLSTLKNSLSTILVYSFFLIFSHFPHLSTDSHFGG